jgi:hypothetical protein
MQRVGPRRDARVAAKHRRLQSGLQKPHRSLLAISNRFLQPAGEGVREPRDYPPRSGDLYPQPQMFSLTSVDGLKHSSRRSLRK